MEVLKIDGISDPDCAKIARALAAVDRMRGIDPIKKPNYFVVISAHTPRVAFKKTLFREFAGSYLRIATVGRVKAWRINLRASMN